MAVTRLEKKRGINFRSSGHCFAEFALTRRCTSMHVVIARAWLPWHEARSEKTSKQGILVRIFIDAVSSCRRLVHQH